VDSTGSVGTQNGNRIYDYIVNQWKQPITEQTLKVAVEKLREANQLTFKSAARIKFDQASSGWTPDQIDFVVNWMKRNGLDTDGDNAFVNAAALMNAMSGRTLTTDNLTWCLQYVQGKGAPLVWKPRPTESTPHRGHNANRPPTAEDMRWMPKEEVNRAHVGKINHSSDPRFNGTLESERRLEQERRFGGGDNSIREDIAMAEKIWQSEIDKLRGETYRETERIQQAARSAPGSARQRHEAAVKMQQQIRREKELMR